MNRGLIYSRLKYAAKFAGLHALFTVAVAIAVSWLVFRVWYPSPYGDASGGAHLFWLVIAIDVICGPLLTLLLFNQTKSRFSRLSDITLIVLVQLAALGYGMWSVWLARPLFLVYEVDRFKVISKPDLREDAFAKIPANLLPGVFDSPVLIGLRAPNDQERKTVLFESALGGDDYSSRPEFYVPYSNSIGQKALTRAKPIAGFISNNLNSAQDVIAKIESSGEAYVDRVKYLPVMARKDWIALLNSKGEIIGFVAGDGFAE